MSEWIFDATASNFGTDVVEKSNVTPVLVDFWADWCEPCKNLMPVLHSVVEQAAGALLLAKVNTDQEQAMAMQMGIQSLPTVALVKGGQIVDSFTGLKSETELKEWLAPHIVVADQAAETVIDPGLNALIASGQYEAALAQLQNQPIDQVFAPMIQIYVGLGELAAAQKVFDGLDESIQKTPQAVQSQALIDVAQVDISERPELEQVRSLMLSGQYEVALEQLLAALGQPGEKAAIKQMLIAAFGLLEDPKAVASYRRRMSRMLF